MKKEIPTNMFKVAQELEYYGGLQNDEYGEMCSELATLWSSRSALRLEFVTDLENEMTWHLQNILDNTELKEEVYTPSSYVMTTLTWKDE